MGLDDNDRDFLIEWIVKPLSDQIKAIHTPLTCPEIKEMKEQVKGLRDQQKKWAGGLAIIAGIGGMLVAFKDEVIKLIRGG